MRLLDRYIGRSVVIHSLVVLAVLLALYFFSLFITELDSVGRGKYGVVHALGYTMLLIPRQAYELFPMVALLGSMLGLGALASNSELTVIRAAGVSVRRVLGSVLKVGLAMVLVVGILGEGIAPWLEKRALEWRASLMEENITLHTQGGLWARDGNTFFQIKNVLSTGIASDVTLYHLDSDFRVSKIVVARNAIYKGGDWELQDVLSSNFNEGAITTTHIDTLPWHSSLTPEVMGLVSIPPENLSIWDLAGYIGYLSDNGLDSGPYELSLWIRVMTPLATAGMVLLSVPFVFGSMRSVALGRRVTVGALIGIGFYLFNAIFSRLGLVFSLPPFFSAALPTALVYIAWAMMMRRVK
ncbi:MAG TPA: LPS export ABC transporter permease LptG [Gammaproteobacteria bacterium]